jgi:hypothetical protein
LQKLDQSYDYLVIAKWTIVGVPHRKVEFELLNAASIVHGQRMRNGAA